MTGDGAAAVGGALAAADEEAGLQLEQVRGRVEAVQRHRLSR